MCKWEFLFKKFFVWKSIKISFLHFSKHVLFGITKEIICCLNFKDSATFACFKNLQWILFTFGNFCYSVQLFVIFKKTFLLNPNFLTVFFVQFSAIFIHNPQVEFTRNKILDTFFCSKTSKQIPTLHNLFSSRVSFFWAFFMRKLNTRFLFILHP